MGRFQAEVLRLEILVRCPEKINRQREALVMGSSKTVSQRCFEQVHIRLSYYFLYLVVYFQKKNQRWGVSWFPEEVRHGIDGPGFKATWRKIIVIYSYSQAKSLRTLPSSQEMQASAGSSQEMERSRSKNLQQQLRAVPGAGASGKHLPQPGFFEFFSVPTENHQMMELQDELREAEVNLAHACARNQVHAARPQQQIQL